MKTGSDNTLHVVCDEGWSISMRIHNAESQVIPSLKFDVQLISVPHSIVSQVAAWAAQRYTADSLEAVALKVAEESSNYEVKPK